MRRLFKKGNIGFTLAELLIVVAIIGVLVGVAIPVFTKQLEKSREAADLANVRSAYSQVMMAAMVEDKSSPLYQSDGTYQAVVSLKQKSNGWSTPEGSLNIGGVKAGDDNWIGRPAANGRCRIIFSPVASAFTINWGGVYSGMNVISSSEYNSLTNEEKVEKDLVLIDGLQDEFRNMTYGQIRNLFMNSNGTIKSGFVTGYIDGYLCVTLSYSTIDNDGNVVTGNGKTNIYLESVFQNAGFNVDLEDNETYIVNSVQDKTQTIWVNLRMTQNELKNLTSSSAKWNQKASSAYTYVKSGGAATPEVLREANRKNN